MMKKAVLAGPPFLVGAELVKNPVSIEMIDAGIAILTMVTFCCQCG
jgi:hypothetical protein